MSFQRTTGVGIFLVFVFCQMVSAQHAFVVTNTPVDKAVLLAYDPADGSAVLTSRNLDGITTTSLQSVNSLFDPNGFHGSITGFDRNTESLFFKLTAQPNIVDGLQFGPGWLPPGLTPDEVVTEVKWFGSLFPSGSWADAEGGGPYFLVPEPTACFLIAIGMVGLVVLRR